MDGGLNNDTLVGSSNADHFGWNSQNYSGPSYIPATNSAVLNTQGVATNISSADKSYFSNIETISSKNGADSFYFGGDPYNNLNLYGEDGNDTFIFDYSLTKNITAIGGNNGDVFTINQSPDNSGVLTLQGNDSADQFNFNTDINSGTIVTFGGTGADTFQFDNANITSNVTLNTGDDADKFSFVTQNSGVNLEISDLHQLVITLNLVLQRLMEVTDMF